MKKISFTSQNETIIGCLYEPQQMNKDQCYPAIILCNGFAGVKELLLPSFAEAFADAGYIVLTFDYRGFGESEGEKGRLVPKLQIEDIHAAIDFLSSLDNVDSHRIGLWGTSYGGANAIIATDENSKIKCLALQLTFANGERVVTGEMNSEEKEKFLAMISRLVEKKDKTGKEMMTPLIKVLSDPQSQSFYNKYCNDFPDLKIKIPFLTVNETLSHKPEHYIGNIHVPILIVGSQTDSVNPAQESHILYEKANSPKEIFMVEKADHYDCYEGEAFKSIVAKQIDWFNKYL